MPPHRGHELLIEFGRHYCDDLTVLVCTLDREPIPGHLRFDWVRTMCPGVSVVHVTDDLPQEPADHPDFWTIWKATVEHHVAHPIDFVFASEDYGWKLAEVLDAEYVPVDHARSLVPVSGSAIRADPMGYWDGLPECVRPHYVKRVCVFGPESTGKSTLAAQLAGHYGTVYAWEYARPLLDFKQGEASADDIPRIVRGQVATEEALAKRASRVLFCDTDVATTAVWSRHLFGECPAWIDRIAAQRQYDLTLLLDVDVPWVDDHQRCLGEPAQRAAFFAACEAELRRLGRDYVVIRGGWPERFEQATQAVDALLG
ncbi:AAA family ATPase [Phycisphaeraceae bacterium D3-23]